MQHSMLNNLSALAGIITGLTQDSRRVAPGFLFAALTGTRQDGRDFIVDAVKRGATHILLQSGSAVPEEARAQAVILESDNPYRDFARIAGAFYKDQPENIVAVTGTNGKTSTAHFMRQLWEARSFRAASLGTLGVHGAGIDRSGSMTTPDPVSLYSDLADLSRAGVTHLAMEASSHGLKQHRLDAVRVKAAGFTNLTRDHLDYHPDMDDYRAAKTRLFTDILQPGGVAVLNADVPDYAWIHRALQGHGITTWSYGVSGDHIRLINRTALPEGQKLEIEILGQRTECILPLVGEFMAMNALCALGLALALDADWDYVSALPHLTGAPGRLQYVDGHPNGAAVYVDYAHTPDALSNILSALRPHVAGRLVCLFGCGGDRDPGKRPMMGEIASAMADEVIVTDDNPRSENPEFIRNAIMAACGPNARAIPSRRDAIMAALDGLEQGDVLVLAGKGHEQGQIFADHTEHFDDVEEAVKGIEILKTRKEQR